MVLGSKRFCFYSGGFRLPSGVKEPEFVNAHHGGLTKNRCERKYLDDRSHLMNCTGVGTIQPTAEKILMRSDAPESRIFWARSSRLLMGHRCDCEQAGPRSGLETRLRC